MKRGGRLFIIGLILFALVRLPVFSAQSADLFGAPKAPKPMTGEVAAPPLKSGVPDQLVAPAQLPAAELERQIRGFRDQRGPPSDATIDMSVQRDRNGEWVVDYVRPGTREADDYQVGDPLTREPTDSEVPEDSAH